MDGFRGVSYILVGLLVIWELLRGSNGAGWSIDELESMSMSSLESSFSGFRMDGCEVAWMNQKEQSNLGGGGPFRVKSSLSKVISLTP